MYCTKKRVQKTSADFSESLIIPSPFKDYVNKWTTEETTTTGRQAYCFHGDLYYAEEVFYCERCGHRHPLQPAEHAGSGPAQAAARPRPRRVRHLYGPNADGSAELFLCERTEYSAHHEGILKNDRSH